MLTLQQLRQKNYEFKASMSYTARYSINSNSNKNNGDNNDDNDQGRERRMLEKREKK